MRRGPGTVTANDIATRCSRYTPEPAPHKKKKIPCCVGGFLRVCMVLMCASVKRTMAPSPSNGYSHLRHD